jgi:hypothetical protein
MGTAIAMDVPPVNTNNFNYLSMKQRAPKAGVTGSTKRQDSRFGRAERAPKGCRTLMCGINPVGRARFLGILSGAPDSWAVKGSFRICSL